MRKLEVKELSRAITFEGTDYLPGIYIVTNAYCAKEPGCYVVFENGDRVEVEGAVGVISNRTADRLLHNWPEVVSEVDEEVNLEVAEPEEPKPKPKRKRKASDK